MRLRSSIVTVAALGLANSPLALAQDVRVTATGTVQSTWTGGTGAGPFAGAAVGEPVTLTFDVEIANQLPFGVSLGMLNWPSSSLSIGGASDGIGFELGQQVHLGDNAVQLGDYVSLQSVLASDPATQCQLLLSDPSGQTWATGSWSAIVGTQVQAAGLNSAFLIWTAQGAVTFDLAAVRFDAAPGGFLGTPYCTAAANSTGAAGLLSAYGLGLPAQNDLTLRASELPTQTVGYFLVSASQGFVPNAGGSEGNLCLSGAIGRFVGSGQVKATDFGGQIALPIDLTQLPSPTGALAVLPGETWNFQLWHRDSGPAGSTSNFTRALALTFQ